MTAAKTARGRKLRKWRRAVFAPAPANKEGQSRQTRVMNSIHCIVPTHQYIEKIGQPLLPPSVDPSVDDLVYVGGIIRAEGHGPARV